MQEQNNYSDSMDIAIIGMAGRFPGANNMSEFWENLKHGVESIRFYSEEEVLESGIAPDMARDPNFVAAAGGMDHEFDFDADFFEFNPREAEITDPQQRVALECAWEALEAAGYNPENAPGLVGVYAGVSINTYLLFNLASNHQLLNSVGHFQVMTANDKDFLATRIAYKLNLKGPAVSVQTACSTGLVAVNMATQSLLNYQSDIALAGAVSITPKGRLYSEAFIFSKDGRCRAFDEAAQGTVGGNGVGFVVLKRLSDAVADGDHIHAIIKGSAINNDGSMKVGYTAPSVSGQAAVILEAQSMAGVNPETITYMEAHGTGTLLGDPIEVAALTQAFRTTTDKNQYCAIGSVKTNIGHLDTVAGVSGFMKAILTVENQQIPPSLHFTKANPKLNIEHTPFFVNTKLTDWKTEGFPRRAAISSFGFGGTNAHTIIEEAPQLAPSAASREHQLLLVSGRDENALHENLVRLGKHLATHPEANLADVAYTLQIGRKHFQHRAYLVADDVSKTASALSELNAKLIVQGSPRDVEPTVVFMFSGQGAQYVGMAGDLYQSEPVFKTALDRVADAMHSELETDLRDILYPKGDIQAAEALLAQTQYTQPALFAIEYALAQLWQSWGVNATTMIGHSIGEYVAATLAGVFTLEDAARLVCLRGRIVQQQPGGSMLSVPLPEKEVLPLLNPQLSLAAVNAPGLCVVAGQQDAVDALQKQLAERGIESRPLVVSHAFHSHMLEDAAVEFEKVIASVLMQAPKQRYISNVSGTWVTADQATSARYWADHLRQPVRFSQGLATVLAETPSVLLEVGPGQVLTTLARQHRDLLQGSVLVNSTRHPLVENSDIAQINSAVGQLYLSGVTIDWTSFHHHGARRRVPLPTYAFQRQRYWIPPTYLLTGAIPTGETMLQEPVRTAVHKTDLSNYQPPRDELEFEITSVWEKMLGINQISINDDFFKLGGHSLLAIQLVSEVRNVTGSEVTIQDLFKNPTISGLSDEIREFRAVNPDFKIMTIPHIDRNGILPLSFHQQGVWEFEHRRPNTSYFIGSMCLKLSGSLNVEACHFAINEIIRRHEVLRTNYRTVNGVDTAVIRPFHATAVPFHDLSQLPPATRDKRLLEIGTRAARQPFDLENDLCIRPELVKLNEHEHMLVIASHYIASDSWAIGLVVQELGAHYKAFIHPELPRMPERPYQFVDYAAWQLNLVNDDAINAGLPYWQKQLANVQTQDTIPTDYLRPTQSSMQGSSFHFSLGKGVTDAIKSYSHQKGTTLFITLLAGLNALYHSYSKSNEVMIGGMVGDREIGTEAMLGSVINTLALRTSIQPTDTFSEIVDRVRATVNDAYTHQIPFSEMAKRMSLDLSSQPLFRNVFILRTVSNLQTSTDNLNIKLAFLPLDRAVAETDLTLYLQDEHDVIGGYFEYSTDLFKRSTIDALTKDFIYLFRNVLACPDAPLSDLLPTPAARLINTEPVLAHQDLSS